MFDHSERVHPVYFRFPFQRVDDVNIDLPLGWQISVLPPPQKRDAHTMLYTFVAENNKGTLHLNRVLTVDIQMLDPKYYPTLRTIFQGVKTADEQQVVLQPAGVSGGN